MCEQEGWTRQAVRDVIISHASGPSPTCEERNVATSQEWGLLKTTAVVWDGWDPTAHKVPPRRFWRNSLLEVQADDVLVTKAGPRHRCGVVVYVPNTPPRLMVSGKMVLLRPDKNRVDPVVLAFALATDECQRFIDSRTTGMADAQLNFTNELLLNTRVNLPPLPEQRKIARILTTVDKLIEKTEALIAKYQSVKRGMMHDLFTRGVDEHGHLRPPYEEAPHLYKNTELGWIPKLWEVPRFDDVTPPDAPICYGIVQPGEYEQGGIRVVAIHNLKTDFKATHRSSCIVESKYARSRIRGGDVLLSVKGTTGRVDVVPTWFVGNISRDIARIRPNARLSSEYLRQMLATPLLQQHLKTAIVGTTRAELSIGVLRRSCLIVPRPNEQEFIAGLLQSVDQKLASERSYLKKMWQLKTALMQDLLTGKVPVAGVDFADFD